MAPNSLMNSRNRQLQVSTNAWTRASTTCLTRTTKRNMLGLLLLGWRGRAQDLRGLQLRRAYSSEALQLRRAGSSVGPAAPSGLQLRRACSSVGPTCTRISTDQIGI